MAEKIPAATIDALARSVYKEATSYGFAQVDVIRLINTLMDHCTNDSIAIQSESRSVPVDIGLDGSSLPLIGERLSIREFDPTQDRALLDTWLHDKYGRFFVLSCDTAQSASIDSLCRSESNRLAIICLLDGTPIGAMAYLNHSLMHSRAELRKLIGVPKYRGKGFAEEATRMWIAYGLQHLKLKKICVSTLQTQISNIRLNESVGFRVEGLLRDEVCVDGERCDVLRMGLNADDFVQSY